MSTLFPTDLDAITNPSSSDKVSVVSHSAQHTNENDAIEAMQVKIGIDNSAVATSLDYLIKNTSSSNPGHKHTLANGATDITATVAEVNVLSGIPATLTATELGYVDGVTSAIQTQINGKQASLTFGIADTNKVQINAADVADNDYAKFTATGLEGRSYAEVLSDIGASASGHDHSGVYQPADADLTAIAGLSSADSNFIVGSAGGWVAESGATARTSLGLGTGDSPTFAGLSINQTDATVYSATAYDHSNFDGANASSTAGSFSALRLSALWSDGTYGAVILNAVSSASYSNDLVIQTRNAGNYQESARLDYTGNFGIAGVYKVDSVQVVGNRVIDARCDDAINSGDATTDGVIDALRDAMITHGLIAAA